MRRSRPLKVLEYVDGGGTCPFRDWLQGLGVPTRARIQARILRVELGNLGDYKSIGAGVWELRLDFGPGFRVYFGMIGGELVILLAGGDKNSQRKDILKAQEFWADYKNGDKHGSKK